MFIFQHVRLGKVVISCYSYRSASVGFNWDARLAGSMPNTTPTNNETPKATKIYVTESGTRNALVKNPTLSGTAVPIKIPMTPPPMLISTASVRNCSSTSRRDAPTAIRSPISRVRSVTANSGNDERNGRYQDQHNRQHPLFFNTVVVFGWRGGW